MLFSIIYAFEFAVPLQCNRPGSHIKRRPHIMDGIVGIVRIRQSPLLNGISPCQDSLAFHAFQTTVQRLSLHNTGHLIGQCRICRTVNLVPGICGYRNRPAGDFSPVALRTVVGNGIPFSIRSGQGNIAHRHLMASGHGPIKGIYCGYSHNVTG